MATDEKQPLRIALRANEEVNAEEIAAFVAQRVPADQFGAPHVEPLVDSTPTRDWLLEVGISESIGSPEYASTAWDLVHRLQDTGQFAEVEADVPVSAFDPGVVGIGAFGSDDCTTKENAKNHEWVLARVGWEDANAQLPDAAKGGRGIRLGHPDSGFATHFALGDDVIDRTADWDVIRDNDDATDPLKPPKLRFFNALPNPGHGTSTASVIVGRGDEEGFHGLAPNATLVPFRATESVIQVFDSDVAKSVRRARRARCHIVSMSLGGTGFFGLKDAIQEAVDDGMIVMAAAGNKVGIVTAPAYYDNCLAVAATGADDSGWSGSSRGSAVDVSAPGSCVWAALFDWAQPGDPGRVVRQSHGTSYAVAHVAGIAALWLAKWGHQELCDIYGRGRVQALFLHLLRSEGVCARPAGWDDAWGVGRIDAAALLAHALPEPAAVDGVGAFPRGSADDPVSRLAALTDTDEARVREWLIEQLGADDFDERIRRYEGELAYLLMENRSFATTLVSPGIGAFAVAATDPPAAASPELQAILRR